MDNNIFHTSETPQMKPMAKFLSRVTDRGNNQVDPTHFRPEAQFKKFLSGKKSNMDVATAELDLYLQEATLDTNGKPFDVLKWWSINYL
ncbi:hypothetical protein PGT21_011617 [Puccinia graminis f. sp. tritici]|uniref:Uncharacterized protein n=1 Tax=Puccinia graminis f. sp. tritici TaxID=56615 RepID=A0A5B0MI14_PUCGR|nr:hypothetical protein PGT21_011617 [Puccinia graminis f. sp. tritici]